MLSVGNNIFLLGDRQQYNILISMMSKSVNEQERYHKSFFYSVRHNSSQENIY
jgi:hypothetical protein